MTELPPGTIDLHVHVAPDGAARSIDALRLAREVAFSGAVFKGHDAPTGGVAALVRQEVPGFLAFGSVVLNHSVGGLNPAAVEALAQVGAGTGRLVWLPTRDAANHLARKRRAGLSVTVVEDGRPVAVLHEVAEAAAARGMVLASGHLAPAETISVFTALAHYGLRLVATHVTAEITPFAPDELAAVLDAGAIAELCARNLLVRRSDRAEPDADRVAAAAVLIRHFGADRFLLSSDLGDPRFPEPAEGLSAVAGALLRAGVGDAALESLLVATPRWMAGLDDAEGKT